MGVEFHITRADFWAENDDEQISSDEWLDIVNNDPELSLSTQNGEFHAIWSGEGSDGEDWLDWSEGNIKTKWPPSPLYRKMLQISQKLYARVMDDDGTLYEGPDDWQYDPKPGYIRIPLPLKMAAKWQQSATLFNVSCHYSV